MRVEVETRIDAPWTEVFAVVTDVRAWPSRLPAIGQVEVLTPGPVRVGTRFRETRRVFGRSATEEMTVVELVAPSRFVLGAENHGTRYRVEHTLADTGDRRTHLAVAFSGEPLTFGARLFAPLGWLMLRYVRLQIVGDVSAVKQACERGSTDVHPG
ncbi:MAG: SRPBCC family protein [Hyphomicrobiaceae bacterium]